MQIKALYSVHRAVEDSDFTYHIDNKQLLFHSSNVRGNWARDCSCVFVYCMCLCMCVCGGGRCAGGHAFVCIVGFSLKILSPQVANFVGILSR